MRDREGWLEKRSFYEEQKWIYTHLNYPSCEATTLYLSSDAVLCMLDELLVLLSWRLRCLFPTPQR